MLDVSSPEATLRSVALFRKAIDNDAKFYERASSYLRHALDSEKDWIHRRVTKIEFLGLGEARRSTSVDLTVRSDALRHDGRLLVPVAIPVKEPLCGFDLRDERGASVPLLESDVNVFIAAFLLADEAFEFLNAFPLHDDLVFSDEFLGTILEIVAGRRASSATAFARLLEPATPAPDRNTLLLRCSQDFLRLATIFRCNFVLMAMPSGRQNERCVIKVRDERPVNWSSERRIGTKFRELMGLDPIGMEVPIDDAPMGRSFHVETDAPGDLIIERVDVAHRSNGLKQPLEAIRTIVGDVHHLHLGDVDYVASPTVDVYLRIGRAGFITAAFGIMLVAAIAFPAGLLLQMAEVVPNLDGGVQLIIGVPALFVAFMSAAPHPLAHAATRPARLLLFGLAALLLALAGSLALKDGIASDVRNTMWWGCTIYSVIALVPLGITWFRGAPNLREPGSG